MPDRFDVILKDGEVFTPSGLVRADIGVCDGKIAVIGDLSASQAEEIVDARNKLVLPGLIDPHIHFSDFDPDSGMRAVDDYFTASAAAACGGNTTLLDFAVPLEGQSAGASAAARRAEADGEVAVDYSLHVMADQTTPITGQALGDLPGMGITSVKVFTTFGRMTDDWELINTCTLAKDCGMVVMFHAESESLIRGYQDRLAKRGDLLASAFPASRPEITEVAAVQQAILVAEYTGATIYIVHVSSSAAVRLIREAQLRGLPVLAETCPHYLLLTDKVYEMNDGYAYLCCPPVRSPADQAGLWAGLADGTLSTIGSDHCGFSLSQRKINTDDFRKNIKGMPTLESRVPVIFSEGVVKGRISLERFVAVMSTNAAKIFGLYPRKGALQPGSDADICVIDPNVSWKMSAQDLHGSWEWTPFEGMQMTGKPVLTMVRGQVLFKDGHFVGLKGYGSFIPAEGRVPVDGALDNNLRGKYAN